MSTQEPAARNRPGRSQAGFNLIEVMVALGILAFGILAIASMQESSLLGTSRAYNLTDGTTVAMDRMESLIARAYTDPLLNLGTYSAAIRRFNTSWTVAQGSTANTKTITVTVNWQEAGGASKSTTITCVKCRI